jgi:hypothetical protein
MKVMMKNIDSLEIKWISYYRNLGIVLNMTDGGDGTDWTGKKHSVESIERDEDESSFKKRLYNSFR